MPEKKKAVLYCRTAYKYQDDSVLDAQERTIREYAKLQGYEVVSVIKESCSGINFDRPGINAIYEIIEKEKIDAVISKDISRYGRCLVGVLEFVKKLNEKKVSVLTTTDDDLFWFL